MEGSHHASVAGRAQRWLFASVPRRFRQAWKRHIGGQGLVEYALILVLIAIVVIGSLTIVGRRTNTTFAEISCNLGGGSFHKDNGNGNSNRCN